VRSIGGNPLTEKYVSSASSKDLLEAGVVIQGVLLEALVRSRWRLCRMAAADWLRAGFGVSWTARCPAMSGALSVSGQPERALAPGAAIGGSGSGGGWDADRTSRPLSSIRQ
jgi:hypothetical protein